MYSQNTRKNSFKFFNSVIELSIDFSNKKGNVNIFTMLFFKLNLPIYMIYSLRIPYRCSIHIDPIHPSFSSKSSHILSLPFTTSCLHFFKENNVPSLIGFSRLCLKCSIGLNLLLPFLFLSQRYF